MNARWADEEGLIQAVAVGAAGLAGTLGVAWWANSDWTSMLMREAGGSLTAFVLRGAFSVVDLVAAQAAASPAGGDWWAPLRDGPAVPLVQLAAVVTVLSLLGEAVRGAVTGNTSAIAQACIRAVTAGFLATAGGGLMLLIGDAFSGIGEAALSASGASIDAPLVPLQQVLMDTATQHESGVELFLAFVCGIVIVLAGLTIYLILAMRPVLLAVLIVWLPVAHALSVWRPLSRVASKAWAMGFAVLLADAAILTTFAVVNTVGGQPEGIDRLLFGTAGLVLAAMSPAALARVVGAPEAERAAMALRRGGQAAGVGAGSRAVMVAGAASVGLGAARARQRRAGALSGTRP